MQNGQVFNPVHLVGSLWPNRKAKILAINYRITKVSAFTQLS
jgi:hypothetical protein